MVAGESLGLLWSSVLGCFPCIVPFIFCYFLAMDYLVVAGDWKMVAIISFYSLPWAGIQMTVAFVLDWLWFSSWKVIQHFHFHENYENSSYLFSIYRIYAKNFYVFCLYFSKLLKIKKMFDRQSLVNVTLKIRTKFHSNWLVSYRDILHNVSKNPVSKKTRLKFQNVIFHAHSSYNSQLKWIKLL